MLVKVGRASEILPTLETALTAAVTLRTLSAALDLAFCRAKLWHAAAMRKLGFTKFTSLMSEKLKAHANNGTSMWYPAERGDLERALAAVVRPAKMIIGWFFDQISPDQRPTAPATTAEDPKSTIPRRFSNAEKAPNSSVISLSA
ncbi:hypothetical protein GGG16DRAFT_127030 [Schizophyllum commune]